MNRVTNILEKSKRGLRDIIQYINKEEIFIVLIIIFVGFGGFGLGRLSKIKEGKIPITISQIEALSQTRGEGSFISTLNNQFVASVNGAKYHLPWCSGAKRIKEDNKIWFRTVEEAQAAGYSPASNCKGL